MATITPEESAKKLLGKHIDDVRLVTRVEEIPKNFVPAIHSTLFAGFVNIKTGVRAFNIYGLGKFFVNRIKED